MSEPTLVFEFLLGDRVVRTERIAREFVKIGSLPTSHLQIKDPQVSGIHAVVEVSGDTFHCIDLGSSTGTIVDGEQSNKAQLFDGSIIELGSTRLRFHLERPVATELGPLAGIIREGEAADGGKGPQPTFRYVQILNRPSDMEHYSRRFLSQPSKTDGTVEVAHLWHDRVMGEYIFGKHTGLKRLDPILLFALWFIAIIPLAIWAIQRIGHKQRSRKLTVGPSRKHDILVEDSSVPEDGFTLLTRDGDDTYLHLRRGMDGDVYIDDTRYEVDEVLRQSGEQGLKISEKTRVCLRFGENTIFVHQGTRPKLALPLGGFEAQTWFFVFISIVLHGLLMGLIFLTPPDTRALTMDSSYLEERLVTIIQMEEEPEPEAIPEILETEEGDDEMATTEPGPEGRAGDEQTEEEDRRMAVEGPEHNREVRLSQRQAREEASTRGVLQVFADTSGPSSLFGAVSAAGYDDVSAAGGLYGDTVGLSQGYGGLGLTGGGLSGGGFGGSGLSFSRGFSVGPISTRGRWGGGDGDIGRELSQMRERGAREVDVQLGQAEVDGFLDREIIQRVIRQHRREIRACYQRELQGNTDLEGRVVVHFTIGPTGEVVGARIDETTLNSPAVEECVTRRIMRFRFPEPSTPGLVHVNYPFVFTAGGNE